MKIRVDDSDGEYRGGLFKTDIFNAITCRVWHAPPHPHYRESLIDISGLRKPCRHGSWYVIRISRAPEISGSEATSDSFDADSQAIRITAAEAKEWLKRYWYTLPKDLIRLLDRRGAGATKAPAAQVESDPSAPYMPAQWFAKHYGIPAERLRAARRTGRLKGIEVGNRTHYSVRGAMYIWAEEEIELPKGSSPTG